MTNICPSCGDELKDVHWHTAYCPRCGDYTCPITRENLDKEERETAKRLRTKGLIPAL